MKCLRMLYLKNIQLTSFIISKLASAMEVKKLSENNMVRKLVDTGLLEIKRLNTDNRVSKLGLSAKK